MFGKHGKNRKNDILLPPTNTFSSGASETNYNPPETRPTSGTYPYDVETDPNDLPSDAGTNVKPEEKELKHFYY